MAPKAPHMQHARTARACAGTVAGVGGCTMLVCPPVGAVGMSTPAAGASSWSACAALPGWSTSQVMSSSSGWLCKPTCGLACGDGDSCCEQGLAMLHPHMAGAECASCADLPLLLPLRSVWPCLAPKGPSNQPSPTPAGAPAARQAALRGRSGPQPCRTAALPCQATTSTGSRAPPARPAQSLAPLGRTRQGT